VNAKLIVVGLITFVVGFVLGQARGLVPVSNPPPPAPQPVRTELPPSCVALAEARDRVDEAKARIADIDLDPVRAERGETVGVWLDEMAFEMYPGTAAAELEKAGAEVLWQDCDEYPCLTAFRGLDRVAAEEAVAPGGAGQRVVEGEVMVLIGPADTGTERLASRVRALQAVFSAD